MTLRERLAACADTPAEESWMPGHTVVLDGADCAALLAVVAAAERALPRCQWCHGLGSVGDAPCRECGPLRDALAGVGK